MFLVMTTILLLLTCMCHMFSIEMISRLFFCSFDKIIGKEIPSHFLVLPTLKILAPSPPLVSLPARLIFLIDMLLRNSRTSEQHVLVSPGAIKWFLLDNLGQESVEILVSPGAIKQGVHALKSEVFNNLRSGNNTFHLPGEPAIFRESILYRRITVKHYAIHLPHTMQSCRTSGFKNNMFIVAVLL